MKRTPGTPNTPRTRASPLPERTASGNDSRTFGALASGVRLRILKVVAVGEKTIPDLTRELRLSRATLRYHLSFLLNQGLIEEVAPPKTTAVGRPAIRYRASKGVLVSGYPPRHYEIVGQLALQALKETAGLEESRRLLESKGTDSGKTLIEAFAAKAKVERWTPDGFEQLVLNGLFLDYGILSEVLSRTPGGLTYRSFTCPFLELAEGMPDLVCDALDIGFHRGVDAALGGVRTERVACMGHGDPHCEYRMEWTAVRRSRVHDRRKAEPRRAVAKQVGDMR